MLEFFNHNSCSVVSTLQGFCTDRTTYLRAGPQLCISFNHRHHHGFDWGQQSKDFLGHRKSLNAQRPLPTGNVGETTLVGGCKRV